MLALTGGAGVCLLMGYRARSRARACPWSVVLVDASVGNGDAASCAEGSANVIVNLRLVHPHRAPAALPPLVLSQRLEEEDIAPIFSDTWTGSQVWPASVALARLLGSMGYECTCRRECGGGGESGCGAGDDGADGGHLVSWEPKGAFVVELGAGCGLCGLVAWASGAHTLLTDQAALLPVLESNARAQCNAATAKAVAAAAGSGTAGALPVIIVRAFEWDGGGVLPLLDSAAGELQQARARGNFEPAAAALTAAAAATDKAAGVNAATCSEQPRYILVSDCVNPIYGVESWRQLVHSVVALSRPRGARGSLSTVPTTTFLSYQHRDDGDMLCEFLAYAAQCGLQHRLLHVEQGGADDVPGAPPRNIEIFALWLR